MTTNSRDKHSVHHERLLLSYMLGGTAVFAVVLLLVFLVPLRRERQQQETHIRQVERELLAIWRSRGHVPLHVQTDMARELNVRLKQEWRLLRTQVDTFRGQSPLAQALSSDEEGRIDFKVALFDARIRLAEMAAERNASLPADLGVPEKIATDEDAETRRWQLASVYRLLEVLLDVGVPAVESVEAIPPVVHMVRTDEDLEAQEYLVRLTVTCPFETLLPMIERLSGGEPFFAVRRFLSEKRDPSGSEGIRVALMCGGIRFAPPKPDPGPPSPPEMLEGPYRPADDAQRRKEETLF